MPYHMTSWTPESSGDLGGHLDELDSEKDFLYCNNTLGSTPLWMSEMSDPAAHKFSSRQGPCSLHKFMDIWPRYPICPAMSASAALLAHHHHNTMYLLQHEGTNCNIRKLASSNP
ncbi:hypothetical protein V2G26_008140 [Clonostachys chloroleuca]